MENGAKAAIGATVVLIWWWGVRVGMIYRERNAPDNSVKAPAREVIPEDDLVFLKKKRPDSFERYQGFGGGVRCGCRLVGSLSIIPFVGHAAQYGKSAGTLLGAEPLVVKDAVEQVAPKAATFRIPGGDKQGAAGVHAARCCG